MPFIYTGESFMLIKQAEHMNIRVKLIVLMMILMNRWDMPTDLYPSAPPS